MNYKHWRVILDFDGTLTAEESQAAELAKRSLATLADEILRVPLAELRQAYSDTQTKLLASPQAYWWEVNGLVASYCDEGAFILNTTTLQTLLREHPRYLEAVTEATREIEYDPVADCTNQLFHRHTAGLVPTYRPGARELLAYLQQSPCHEPVILTNSLGDKVARFVQALELEPLRILGDTRQYEMAPNWPMTYALPGGSRGYRWDLPEGRHIDLRRPAYHRALASENQDGAKLAVVADTLSLPGALPLVMGVPFFLVHTPYTPDWCLDVVNEHPFGHVLERLLDLPDMLNQLAP